MMILLGGASRLRKKMLENVMKTKRFTKTKKRHRCHDHGPEPCLFVFPITRSLCTLNLLNKSKHRTNIVTWTCWILYLDSWYTNTKCGHFDDLLSVGDEASYIITYLVFKDFQPAYIRIIKLMKLLFIPVFFKIF